MNTFVNTNPNTDVKSNSHHANSYVAHSSSGQGHRPLKAEITGSNPVCATRVIRESKGKKILEVQFSDGNYCFIAAAGFTVVVGILMVDLIRLLGGMMFPQTRMIN